MTTEIRTLRFHAYGEPAAVLTMDRIAPPAPAANRIRVKVAACGLNPADWALCRGLFPGNLPRGVGCDVSGIVDAVGDGVTDTQVGDRVFGSADFAGAPCAGASDAAILDHWATAPAGLDLVDAAALTMAIMTAYTHLDALGMSDQTTILVHGAGTMIGFAAVQMARLRGARTIATAGPTYADRLRALGATVVAYGEGMADRVLAAAGGPVDMALDTAPPSGALPDLIKATGGDPKRVMTITDFAAAQQLGTRYTFGETGIQLRYDKLTEFGQLAAEGKFTIPIARKFPLDDWRTAVELSMSQKAGGKLLLIP